MTSQVIGRANSYNIHKEEGDKINMDKLKQYLAEKIVDKDSKRKARAVVLIHQLEGPKSTATYYQKHTDPPYFNMVVKELSSQPHLVQSALVWIQKNKKKFESDRYRTLYEVLFQAVVNYGIAEECLMKAKEINDWIHFDIENLEKPPSLVSIGYKSLKEQNKFPFANVAEIFRQLQTDGIIRDHSKDQELKFTEYEEYLKIGKMSDDEVLANDKNPFFKPRKTQESTAGNAQNTKGNTQIKRAQTSPQFAHIQPENKLVAAAPFYDDQHFMNDIFNVPSYNQLESNQMYSSNGYSVNGVNNNETNLLITGYVPLIIGIVFAVIGICLCLCLLVSMIGYVLGHRNKDNRRISKTKCIFRDYRSRY